ncbi:putative RSM22-mitochondrial ribosomal protein, small subunit [Fusarium austroafricanum]|uniref:Putative RSM22-mitochondrial ribosomal protein, small subunit n=1 Tax=Fusarium austroafricanum TaxID=2364996 RepID=A0A8H4KQZ4_9HYPO|nr:putative RSM22-mitochondrial ribosomal protein, small subunit [Fusarium austroafricanum]
MSGPINIGSESEWNSLLSGTNVVIADFYADWCGPCKMIAPTFEALAKEHSRPKKVAFAKVNVDNQSAISRAQGVSAMPTFKIFHNGTCIETIKGANPPALTVAINNAVKLGGSATGDVFKTPGRTLGGESRSAPLSKQWNLKGIFDALIAFFGLYFVSLFTVSVRNKKSETAQAANSMAVRSLQVGGKERVQSPSKANTKKCWWFRVYWGCESPSTFVFQDAGGSWWRLRLCLVSSRIYSPSTPLLRSRRIFPFQYFQSNRNAAITQAFSTSRCLRKNSQEAGQASPEEIEQVVRDTKQIFRDTLPKGYLNDEEYAVYERLYGAPLRETRPEDVGIPEHADMGPQLPRPDNEGTILRQLEGGEFEEITYEIPPSENMEEMDETVPQADPTDLSAEQLAHRTPDYVDLVARSQREYDALQKLSEDFKIAQHKQQEAEDEAAAKEELAMEQKEDEAETDWPEEYEQGERLSGEAARFHPLTLEGRFWGSTVQILLPQDELIMPIRELLQRTHIDHVKSAAESAFGGPGLPLSPATPEAKRNGNMHGVGLPPDQRHMTEIEGDAFLAGFMPPAYASVMATLKEVRKRVGSEWLQSKLKDGSGISVLDAGSGGAGLVAWNEILQAEWDLLREKGEVKGDNPPGKRTVIIGSDRLRHRTKTFLENTTFLPRLPDYEHSGEMKGEHLDAGSKPQPRKSYDVIIASHLFLKEEQDHYRQAVLNNLWTLLNKDGGVLIVLEKAHPRGFEAVAHVRDTVLKQFLLPQFGQPEITTEEINPAFQREKEPGYVVAPCTNQGLCPMYQTPGKSKGRKDFCHFSQRFTRPAFYTRMLGNSSNNQGDVEFSYVAIRRGVAKERSISGKEAANRAFEGYEHSDEKPDMQSLPRSIMPPLKRKGHVTLDFCTPEGKLERWTVTKSFSKLAYHDARKARWGDLWALGAKTRVSRNVRAGRGPDDGGKRAGQGKKPRKVEITMGPGGISASEKNAPRERRGRNKLDKKSRLIQEIIEAEEEEERMIARQMDQEVEAELADESDRRGRP